MIGILSIAMLVTLAPPIDYDFKAPPIKRESKSTTVELDKAWDNHLKLEKDFQEWSDRLDKNIERSNALEKKIDAAIKRCDENIAKLQEPIVTLDQLFGGLTVSSILLGALGWWWRVRGKKKASKILGEES